MNYELINVPHHVSDKHPRMSMNDRAAQFAPFDALKGGKEDDEEDETLKVDG